MQRIRRASGLIVLLALWIVPSSILYGTTRLESAIALISSFAVACFVSSQIGLRKNSSRSLGGVVAMSAVLAMTVAFAIGETVSLQFEDALFMVFTLTGFLTAIHPLGLQGLCLLNGASSLLAFILWIGGYNAFHSGDIARLGGIYGHPTQLASMLAFTIPIGAYAFLAKTSRIHLLLLFVSSVALIFTWCRGPAIGAGIGCLVVTGSQSKDFNAAPLRIVRMLGILLILLPLIYRGSNAERLDASVRSAISRPTVWSASLKSFPTHPFGVGPCRIELTTLETTRSGNHVQRLTHDPKNQLLTFTLSFGFVGLVASCYLVLLIFRHLKRLRFHPHPYIPGCLVAMLIICCFDSPFFIRGHSGLCLLFGCCIGLLAKEDLS